MQCKQDRIVNDFVVNELVRDKVTGKSSEEMMSLRSVTVVKVYESVNDI